VDRHLERECDIQAAILKYFIGRTDLVIWRNNTGVALFGRTRVSYGLKGSSDLIGLRQPAGQLIAIECKAARGRQTKEQVAFQRMVERLGGLYVLARSVDDVRAAGL
jgi:hypothetical protein